MAKSSNSDCVRALFWADALCSVKCVFWSMILLWFAEILGVQIMRWNASGDSIVCMFFCFIFFCWRDIYVCVCYIFSTVVGSWRMSDVLATHPAFQISMTGLSCAAFKITKFRGFCVNASLTACKSHDSCIVLCWVLWLFLFLFTDQFITVCYLLSLELRVSVLIFVDNFFHACPPLTLACVFYV